MLGIRLSTDSEKQLERHARAVGRGKSVIAREWILERLERESIDERVRRASAYLANEEMPDERMMSDEAAAAWFRALDADDGGYDWGDEGPPA